MNNIIGRTQKNKSISENDVSDPQTIADSFCQFFTNIGVKYASEISPFKTPFTYYMKQQPLVNSLFIVPTDPVEICRIIMKMKPKSSCFLDSINWNVLKNVSAGVALPISAMINK